MLNKVGIAMLKWQTFLPLPEITPDIVIIRPWASQFGQRVLLTDHIRKCIFLVFKCTQRVC